MADIDHARADRTFIVICLIIIASVLGVTMVMIVGELERIAKAIEALKP